MRVDQATPLAALAIAAIAGLAIPATAACGTADLGTYEGVRDLKLDENFFYCEVQPKVITAKRCSPGDSGDPAGGCHASKSSMILADVPKPVVCAGGKPIATPSEDERANYSAAQLRVTRDVDGSPLLARPTGLQPHPRVVFASNSAEADLIRAWIKGAR